MHSRLVWGFGGFLLSVGHRVGISRFYLLALLSSVVGVSASLAGLGDILGSGVYFAGMGVALVASGAISLLNYLWRTRPPESE